MSECTVHGPDRVSPNAIEVLLARLETKLDLVLASNTDHESRIRTLERKIWQTAGIASVVGGGGAAAFAQFLAK